ncbi:kelch-like protein 23 [Stylophora pistillata]|uniref:kelch-like protein 23 n=1 Tax=Stylophora pistillata TaxID=50429 RepID=UPI000C04C19A|nr:kelch-like protein 23 [Stylophora pistillata]
MRVKNTNESQRQQTDSSEYGAYSSHSPQCMAHYFDVEAKLWKPLPSLAQLDEKTSSIFCAEHSGNYLFVAGNNQSCYNFIHRYDVVNNSWVKPPDLENYDKVNCLCAIGDYLYAISELKTPQRYSLKNNSWQGGEELNFSNPEGFPRGLYEERLSTVATTVLKSRIYVIHGYKKYEGDRHDQEWVAKPAVVHCFDPKYNEWKKIASTCHPHFGSCLFVVNNKLCVAGGNTSEQGYKSVSARSKQRYKSTPVEVYNEATDTWSVEPQKHIPPNGLGAVEIEGRVYFIINKFPVDSGIRIPPEEMYQVDLSEWKNLSEVRVIKGREDSVVLCYLPVKGENLKCRTQLVLGIYSPPVLQCFHPNKNKWEEKATTCHPHFGSSLFVVNNKLFLAGGFLSITSDGRPYGSPAPVEMYNEETNTWSVVEQKHIPANNLNAVEIEGRVYFIINKFPIDSGIRIPLGELYPVPLGEWENLGNIDQSAVLCYLPSKRVYLKTE